MFYFIMILPNRNCRISSFTNNDLCEIDMETRQRKTEININKLKQIKNN